jgi:hypothetical protein
MFYVTKESTEIATRVDFPIAKSTAAQTVYINGYSHYLVGYSKVKCDEGDIFNPVFGKELAETNAQIKMLQDYKRILIRMTKQSDWLKDKPKEKFIFIVKPNDNKFSTNPRVNMFNNTTDKNFQFTVEEL